MLRRRILIVDDEPEFRRIHWRFKSHAYQNRA